MSLIRQIWLLLGAALLFAFAGGAVVNTGAARDALQTQLSLKNADNAAALALVLSQQRGDAQTMALTLAAQFDTGFYRRVAFVPAGAMEPFRREAVVAPLQAPAWFVRLVPIEPTSGRAQVSDGWRALGAIELASHTAFAHDDLWHGSVRATQFLALVALTAGLAAALLLGRMRRAIDGTVDQARSLEQGRYVVLPEPRPAELRRLTRTMNSMVERLRAVFEGQAEQVEALRLRLRADPLTGVARREFFVERLAADLGATDRPAVCGLLIVRICGLAGLNETASRGSVDAALVALASALEAQAREAGGGFVGRLNGSDFAVALQSPGVAQAAARAIAEALRARFAASLPAATVVVGGVEIEGASPGGAAAELATADQALAQAEARGAFAIEVLGPGSDAAGRLGEASWRARLQQALDAGRATLAEFPVRNRDGTLLHFECPLRMRLDEGGAELPAARWLPLAMRSHLTGAIDERAVELALAAIVRDGVPRSVNLAPASLARPDFAVRLAERLRAAPPQAASRLWLEVAESAALEQFARLQDLSHRLRPFQVRLGLEHAGEGLTRIAGLFELGLDFVKLDAAGCRGIAGDAARVQLVRGWVALLRGAAVLVAAEGVDDPADAQALWDAGADALTGPWASRQGG